MDPLKVSKVGGVWCQLIGPRPVLEQLIKDQLRYRPKNFYRDAGYRFGRWDGYEQVAATHKTDGWALVPVGVWSRVLAWAAEHDITVEGTVGCPLAEVGRMGLRWNAAIQLRPYQQEAVEACRAAGRGVVWMPTGSGKGMVISALVYRHQVPTLIIVPSKELLHQTVKVLREHIPDLRPGMMGDGHNNIQPVTVATYQSLYTSRDDLEEGRIFSQFKLCIVDETQHTPADSLQTLMRLITTPHKFGFSATPWTNETRPVPIRNSSRRQPMEVGSDLLLEAFIGPTIFHYTEDQATESGILETPEVWILDYDAPDVDGNLAWHDLYREGIAENTVRDNRIMRAARMLAKDWGPTLVLVSSVDHGQRLTNRLNATDDVAQFTQGKTLQTDRKRAKTLFASGKRPILVSTVLDEGADIPETSAVVLAAGGRAPHRLIQRIGRGRRTGGQGRLVVVDTWDKGAGTLVRHSQDRLKVYKEHGWDIHWVDRPG